MGRLIGGLLGAALVLFAFVLYLNKSNPNEVSVYNWSNYISTDILDDFEKETGIKVIYNVFDSNEALQTSLLVDGGGYDVVVPSAVYLQRQIRAGVYQLLDKSKLPNLANTWSFLTDKLQEMGDINDYSATYAWGTSGLGYVKKEILKRVPDAPLDSLELIFNENIVSKLADCGVYMLNDSDEMIPAALNYLGLDPSSKNREEIKRAAALLKKIQPYVRKFHSSSYVLALANNEACLVFGWSGDILQARQAAEQTGNGVEITYVIPKEGGQIWFDQMAIPASAPNRENAYTFINYILGREVNARLSQAIQYPTANAINKIILPPEMTASENIYPSAQTIDKLYTIPFYDGELRKFVSQIWMKIKLGL